MGILSSIKDKLFGTKATAATTTAKTATTTATTATKTAAAPTPVPAEPVDVEAILEAAVKAKGQKLNWRVSIVDLLTALDLPNNLAARKELAKELNYTGTDPDGSAEKNMWLHRAVMKMIAENGGKLPKDIQK